MKKLLCMLLLATGRLLAVSPVPFTEGVDYSFKISGTGTATMTVYDESNSPYLLATASGTTIESSTGTAWLCPGKTYTVAFWGGGPSSYVMSFVEPVGYDVYINGVRADEAGASGGSWFLNYYTVEIRPSSAQVGGMWGSFSGIAVGKSVTWSVGLGDLRTGRSAGAIEFKQLDLTNNPTSRDRLYYAAPPANVGQIVVVKDGPSSQTLRQIVTPIGFTDIVDVTGGYEIRCYFWGQVTGWTGTLYTFSGSPWKVIKVESPAALELKITETEGTSSPVVKVCDLTGSASSVATGGTITNIGGYTIHTFTTTGSGASFVPSSNLSSVDYLVVAGGGGGGPGGGGGGGGSVEVLTHQSINAGTYGVTIGAGGPSYTNGNNSSFNGTTAYGGGKGASTTAAPGGGGSSGGGCANNNTGAPPTSGSGSNIHWGGSGDNGSYGWRSGGGGGAGTNGHGVGEGSLTGYGGDGISNSFSGTATYYGGGGGGSSATGPGLPGGSGGGGSSVQNNVGANGTANTGGGGGGGDYGPYAGGTGGSGVVIIRYNTMLAAGAYTWTLKEGDGTTVLRTTTHVSSVPATGQRDDVVSVYTGTTSGTLVAKTKYHYVTQSWGEELDSIIADPDTISPSPSERTTTYAYYTTSTDLGNYRKVKSVTLPTGGWTGYQYYDDYDHRGQLKYQFQPWLDTLSSAGSATTTNCHTFYYEYAADWTGRYTRPTLCEERVNNTLVGKTTWTQGDVTGSGDPRETSTMNSYRDSSNYHSDFSETYRADADPDFAGRPYQIKAANQAQTAVSISRGNYNVTTKAFSVSSSGDHWREMIFHGTTNSGGADNVTGYDSQSCPAVYMIANQSTLDVTIRIAQGYVYRTATYVYTGSGNFTLLNCVDYDYDAYGHCYQSTGSNSALTYYSYTNGRLTYSTDPTGIETDYTYDQLGRVLTSVKIGVAASGSYVAQGAITTTYTYDGANHVTQTVIGSSSPSLTSTASFDLAGRSTQTIAPGSYTTGISYSSGGKIVTVTLPGGATKITEVYPDGQLKSVSGTAVVAESYTPAVDTSTGKKWIQSFFGGNSSAWTNTYFDWLGRKVDEWRPEWDGNNYAKHWYYNSSNQLYKFSQPGMADTVYQYDTLGVQTVQCLDINGNGNVDPSSDDRITQIVYGIYSWDSGVSWWKTTWNYTYPTTGSGSSTPTYLGAHLERMNNISGYAAESYDYDNYSNTTYQYVAFNRTNKIVTQNIIVPGSGTTGIKTSYNGLLVSATDTTNITTTFGYDALGRQVTSTDPRKGATTTAYVSGTSQVSTVTDPASIPQASYTYDTAGRVATVTNALSKVCRYDYTSRNEKSHVWGDTDYPTAYGYDSSGHMTTISTYRGATGLTATNWAGVTPGTADTTTWTYNAATNLLASKADAAGNSVVYTYTVPRQIHTRVWARYVSGTSGPKVTATYSYSSTTGELTGVSYNDSLTPSLSYTYNRAGKPATVTDVTGTRTLNYNLGGMLELQSEDLPSYFNSRRITYPAATTGYIGRPTGLQLGTSGSPTADQNVTYGYDTCGRFSTLAAAGTTFTYLYTNNSNLVGSITDTTSGGSGWSQTLSYVGNRDLVDAIETKIGGTSKAKFDYSPLTDTRDNLGRVTSVQKTGELYNLYESSSAGLTTRYTYDDLSQVKTEITYIGTSTTNVLPGRNDGYNYDTFGNRATSAGTTHNTHTADYTTNALNQYTSRTVPGYFDVAGFSSATTVDVSRSGGVTDHAVARSYQYFFDGYGIVNTSTAVYDTTITITPSTGSPTTIDAYLTKTPEFTTSSYDVDGNLLSDGRWTYTYDAENRLITMETNSVGTGSQPTNLTKQKLTFTYDYLNRRVGKSVQNWNSGTSSYSSPYLSLVFVYDGWNVIAELNALTSYSVLSSHYWGLDIAGSGQTTGGVGALLMTQQSSNSYLPIYDANGNVHGLINASTGAIDAAYEYDAFGNTIRESGTFAGSNNFRFSTKYADLETSLVYYGTRFYSPSQGRFINRDTIEEQGGLNLYAFVCNNGVNNWDYLGQWPTPFHQQTLLISGLTHNIWLPTIADIGAANRQVDSIYPGQLNNMSNTHFMLVPGQSQVQGLWSVDALARNYTQAASAAFSAGDFSVFSNNVGKLSHLFGDGTSPMHVNQLTGELLTWQVGDFGNDAIHVWGERNINDQQIASLLGATDFAFDLAIGTRQLTDENVAVQLFDTIGNSGAANGIRQRLGDSTAAAVFAPSPFSTDGGSVAQAMTWSSMWSAAQQRADNFLNSFPGGGRPMVSGAATVEAMWDSTGPDEVALMQSRWEDMVKNQTQ